MKKGLIFNLGLIISFILLSSCVSFAQEDTQSPAADNNPSDSEVQWLWGEVVNIQDKGFLVKYVDYDTDTEKELSIGVDDKTIFEGVKDLSEIKVQDTVSVDYLMAADKAVAKNISVIKVDSLDETDSAQAPAGDLPIDTIAKTDKVDATVENVVNAVEPATNTTAK